MPLADVRALLQLVIEHTPAVVILNVAPPYADARALPRVIGAAAGGCGAVLLTTDQTRVRAWAGVDQPIVTKPFDLRGLVAAVHVSIERDPSVREYLQT